MRTEDFPPEGAAATVALHRALYAPDRSAGGWGLGEWFVSAVEAKLTAFLATAEPQRDLFRCVWDAEGALAGTVTLDARPEREEPGFADGRLRFFAVAQAAQGRGLGGRLLQDALDRARGLGLGSIYLDTFDGLDRAAALYARAGFVTVTAEPSDRYGPVMLHRRMRLTL